LESKGKHKELKLLLSFIFNNTLLKSGKKIKKNLNHENIF